MEPGPHARDAASGRGLPRSRNGASRRRFSRGRISQAPMSLQMSAGSPHSHDRNTSGPPHILLVTEFFPADPATCVFGVFQRLQRHLEALSCVGPIDAVFFWPEQPLPPEESCSRADMVKDLWPIDGAVRFVTAAPTRRRPLDWIADALWALRGAVGFFHGTATMRSCGRDQVATLSRHIQHLKPDLIFAHRIGGMAPLLRTRIALPPVLVDIDDIEHEKLKRLAQSMPRFAPRLGIWTQALLARHALRRINATASCLLVASELDQSKLVAACRGAKTAIIPNTAVAFELLPKAQSPTACFVGTADYAPNREAILWLLHKIWPLVRAAIPDARLLIAGSATRELAAGFADQGVEGLGFVANLATVYERARIAVCPIRRGGGTRIKIIEAAMNARPVVSTLVGAEGLSLTPGAEILVEDEPAGFARACIALLQDPDLAASFGEAAQRRAAAVYDPARIRERLIALCRGLLDGADNKAQTTAGGEHEQSAPIEIGQLPNRSRAGG
ncbi:MAG: glycosyltransferase [Bradyrhizobium sp.]|nr:MAG: glycosyltransferase [Bradyrhizobium sp.]